MEPPGTLTCDLRSYQKQALHWMSELEKGIDVEKAAKTLHPCWAAYRITDPYVILLIKKKRNKLLLLVKSMYFQFLTNTLDYEQESLLNICEPLLRGSNYQVSSCNTDGKRRSKCSILVLRSLVFLLYNTSSHLCIGYGD